MKSLRILIIEDNLIEANDICETLERAGHIVTTIARNYSEAMHSVRQTMPDLALVDIKLEDSSLDGISITKELRKDYQMPVLYLTASSEYETFQRAKRTQPAAYLLKPIRHAELALQIELAYYNYRINQVEVNQLAPSNDLYVYLNKGYQRVAKDNIVFLEGGGAYVKLFLADPPIAHLLSVNIGYLEQYLKTPNFYRLSRSVLINLNYLERLETESIIMRHAPIPLPLPKGSPNRTELLKRITQVKNRKSDK